MKVGIGYQNQENAYFSGRLTAREALSRGKITRPSLALVFCGGDVDHIAFFNGFVEVVGTSTPIVGGSAIGLITNNNLSYSGYPAGAAVFELDDSEWKIASARGLDTNEYSVGEEIGRQLSTANRDDSLLLFYDSLKAPSTEASPPIMNASPRLLQGITSVCKPPPRIFGAGLLGDYSFRTSIQFSGDHVGKQEAICVHIGSSANIYARIMHGCTPHDGIYHTVTRSEGAVLYEVDGKPAVDLVDSLYGNIDWRKQVPVRRLSIGVNNGDKYAEFEEGNFVNRLIAGVLPHNDGIVLFEPDLPEGTEILFMIRDAEEMIQSARKNTGELLIQIAQEDRRPTFGLYIDCGGRAADFSWTETEEAAEVQRLFNHHEIPLLGFYSGVEIAPFQGCSRGLDWTGVLMIFTD
jgi:hypothetical protein